MGLSAHAAITADGRLQYSNTVFNLKFIYIPTKKHQIDAGGPYPAVQLPIYTVDTQTRLSDLHAFETRPPKRQALSPPQKFEF